MPDTYSTHDTEASTGLPLSRLRVLDLTLARAGPTCVRHLADWGAEVIRIEQPETAGEDISGARDGFDFQNLHRNKRAVSLNLKHPDALAAFMALAATADVIVENMRATVKYRLGIDYDSVRKVNPRLVYASISGFGQDGPYSARAGVDQIAQGMGGLMSITGIPGQGPVRAGIPMVDLTAGNLLAFGVMVALFDRERSGVGRWVHTSLLESMVFMLDFQAARWLMNGEVAGQAGNDHPTGIPTGVFPTADRPINIAASGARLWGRFCATIGQPEWEKRPGWDTSDGRSKDRAAINAAIAAITATEASAHWIDLFEANGIPCGPINRIDEVFADPQVAFLGMATPMPGPSGAPIQAVSSAINISGIDDAIRSGVPARGADTDAILEELGYAPDGIAKLRTDGAI